MDAWVLSNLRELHSELEKFLIRASRPEVLIETQSSHLRAQWPLAEGTRHAQSSAGHNLSIPWGHGVVCVRVRVRMQWRAAGHVCVCEREREYARSEHT